MAACVSGNYSAQMALRRGPRRAGSHQRKGQEYCDLQDTYLLQSDHSPPLTELSQSASWGAGRKEHRRERGPSLREQLTERDQHVARLQVTLRRERDKCSCLQSRSNQQVAELRRREQQSVRLKERLSQLTERHRERSASIEILNTLPRVQGRRDQSAPPARANGRREEVALRLMLVRREAELQEAMKLRHSLTTLLHALRADMERTLLDTVDDQEEGHDHKRLVQSESVLGDHVTGGVVQGWGRVQRRLGDLLIKGHVAVETDQDKLFAQLETELENTQQLVKLQQQLLQDSIVSAAPPSLADSYFLEDWERLQARCAELEQQRRSFQRERQAFTDAAIRLGHERCEFEQRKASLLKQQYLCNSPFGSKTGRPNRGESTALSFFGSDHVTVSGCCPATPSCAESGVTTLSGSLRGRGRVRVQTPSTPELYSAFRLPYSCRSSESEAQSDCWEGGTERVLYAPPDPHMDWSF